MVKKKPAVPKIQFHISEKTGEKIYVPACGTCAKNVKYCKTPDKYRIKENEISDGNHYSHKIIWCAEHESVKID